MRCTNHAGENAWYYLKVLPENEDECEVKLLLCLGCSESARDQGMNDDLYEVPYGAEHKVRGL